MSEPQIMYWLGEPVDDLPRETLLEIVGELYKELDASRQAHKRTLEVWSMFRKARHDHP